MFRLETEFYRLPLRLDAVRLAAEVSQSSEEDWRAHPQGHAGNSALLLATVGGGMNDDVKGPMRATAHLDRCPYIRQVLAALETPIGRARLMRIAGQADATEHVDTNYYWMHHVRVHIPAITNPKVEFVCNGKGVHMAPGEAWIFDSWMRHNVLNPADAPRIHLVADTVGSGKFWSLVERSARPFDPDPANRGARGVVELPWRPGVEPVIEFEEENFPLVMSPWEQKVLAERMLEDLPPRSHKFAERLRERLERLHQEWHGLWTRSGAANVEYAPLFREVMNQFDSELDGLAGGLVLLNGVDVPDALRQAIVRPAVNPEVSQAPLSAQAIAPRPAPAPVAPPSRFDRPIFIVAAPRSGSSMLFELLSRSADVWTIGGESHQIFEGIPKLQPAAHDWDSNRLTAEDADPETIAALHEAFLGQLRDYAGQPPREHNRAIRMLEKTPKNALRIPFLAAAFPGARFIYLYREPAENISSIMEAWRSGKFVTYPELPGGGAWSLALVERWRDLIGRPVAEIGAGQWMGANSQILDDLAAIPRGNWCGISYEEVVRDPQTAAQRLCAFAGIAWYQKVEQALPHSRYTLTPPDPEKWRSNEADMASVLPAAEPVADRARAALRENAPPPPPTEKPQIPSTEPVAFNSQYTESFADILDKLGISLAISTYQAGNLILARPMKGELNTHFCGFSRPMGIAYMGGRLAVGARHELWTFRNFPALGEKVEPGGHDAVFVPAARHCTGDIRIHEIAWVGEELWAVNTQFSCLCTFDGLHSFIPRWRPPFVTRLAGDDRCHLNGMAIVDGAPAYVTCHGMSDEREGWRAHKVHGGCIIDVRTGETVATGLSMPHSPRWYDGRLWVLESGHGRISTVDPATGKVEVFAELPGFTRGLDFYGNLAFVGLSQVRETAVFSGVPIATPGRERNCGVWVLDLRNGKIVAFLQFTGTVQEVFAVAILPGIRNPALLTEDSDLLAASFMVPPEALEEAADAPAPAESLAGVT
jgi:uncharacterized protein (TIGR03032 family)